MPQTCSLCSMQRACSCCQRRSSPCAPRQGRQTPPISSCRRCSQPFSPPSSARDWSHSRGEDAVHSPHHSPALCGALCIRPLQKGAAVRLLHRGREGRDPARRVPVSLPRRGAHPLRTVRTERAFTGAHDAHRACSERAGHPARDRGARAHQALFGQRRDGSALRSVCRLRRGQLHCAVRLRGVRLERDGVLRLRGLLCGAQKKSAAPHRHCADCQLSERRFGVLPLPLLMKKTPLL